MSFIILKRELTGIGVFLALQQSDLKEPFLVTDWKILKLFTQSYVISRVSKLIPAKSGGDAIDTGFEPLQ
jgi:hypothetical protein